MASKYHVGTTISGKYRLIRPLGEGAAGSVWEAENELVGRRVAIKILNSYLNGLPGVHERFLAEAKLSAKLAHPNVVDVFDLGNTEDGTPYIVMEVLNGETLESVLERRGRLPAPEACELMLQVLSTLVAAHELEIVHRDLKPANIMLIYPRPEKATVKVLDFGVAQGLIPATHESGLVIGTPSYMSPEQAAGAALDQRTDLYAASVILYELLSGELPIDGDSVEAVLVNVMTREPVPLHSRVAGVPVELEDVIMSALEKEPSQRPQTAREMITVIAQFAHSVPSNIPLQSESPMALTQRRDPAIPKRTDDLRRLELVLESSFPPADETESKED